MHSLDYVFGVLCFYFFDFQCVVVVRAASLPVVVINRYFTPISTKDCSLIISESMVATISPFHLQHTVAVISTLEYIVRSLF